MNYLNKHDEAAGLSEKIVAHSNNVFGECTQILHYADRLSMIVYDLDINLAYKKS